MLRKKHLIFKITIASIALSLSLALSILEIPIPIPQIPGINFEISDVIILLVIPLIGNWLALLIGSLKPWLHILIPHHVDHGNSVLNATFGMLLNIFVITLYFSLNWFWNRIFKKETIYTKCTTIFICCLLTSLFASVNADLWGLEAFGFHSHHDHQHTIAHASSLNNHRLLIYGVYGGFMFLKYLITFILMLFLEKPILKYTERLHYSYHKREKDRKKNK